MSEYQYCPCCGATSHDGDLVCPECGSAMHTVGGFYRPPERIIWGDVAVTIGVFSLLSCAALTGIWTVMHLLEKFGGGVLAQLMRGVQ